MSLADRCIDLDPGCVYYISTFWHDDSIDSPRCCIRQTINQSEFSTRFNFWLWNVFKFSCLFLSSKQLKESFSAIILTLFFSIFEAKKNICFYRVPAYLRDRSVRKYSFSKCQKIYGSVYWPFALERRLWVATASRATTPVVSERRQSMFMISSLCLC